MKQSAAELLKGIKWVKADAHAAGAVNGTGQDCQGFGEALFVVSVDDVTGGGTVNFKVQESDTLGGTYVDVAGAAIAQKAAVGIWVGRVDCEKRKRFMRGVLTIGVATTDAAVLGALIPNKNRPVIQTATKEFDV